jgi:hypothetical protein
MMMPDKADMTTLALIFFIVKENKKNHSLLYYNTVQQHLAASYSLIVTS